MVEEFVKYLRTSCTDSFVRGYLQNVHKYADLMEWSTHAGKIARPLVLPLAKYKFLPKLAVKGGVSALRKAIKVLTKGINVRGKRIPILKYFFAAAIYNSAYHDYIAEGASPSHATAMAIAETINPYPIGILEANKIIQEYNMRTYGEYYYGYGSL